MIPFKAKFIIDFDLLSKAPTILNTLKDSLFIVPFSSYMVMKECYSQLSENESEETRKTIDDLLGGFFKTIDDSKILDELKAGKEFSSLVCYDSLNNIYLSLTSPNLLSKTDENKYSKFLEFSEEDLKDINFIDVDTLNLAYNLNIDILSTNKNILKVINNKALPIKQILIDLNN